MTTTIISSLPSVSIHAPVSEIAECIENCSEGVLLIKDLPKAPFEQILNLLQHSSNVTTRLNQACPNVLIYKDSSHAARNGGRVDQKCTLDLSLERLESIAKVDPEVVQAEALKEPLLFYTRYQDLVNKKLIPALGEVIGSNDISKDVTFSYRMIDYYISPQEHHQEQAIANARPRLAEHRDFGFITLIQSSQPGLQVRIGKQWKNLPPVPNGTAIMMGGWCARIRSNGRMSAILHRVPKNLKNAPQSRVSAVLFCNPKCVDTSLDPVVKPGETCQFIEGVNAAALQQRLAESKTEKAVDQWLAYRSSSKSSRTTTNNNKKRNFLSRFRRG